VYVDLSKEAVSGSDSGNLHGELCVNYNNSVTSSLDSDKIVSTLKMEGLDSTNKLKNFEGAIPAELGIARLTYKAPLNELAVILANNPDVQMGAFTSDFLWLYKTTLCSTGLFKLHDSFVLAASSKFPLSEEFKTLLKELL
jgi:hypothetical protein